MDRPFRLVLIGLRITEIGQHAVAEQLRHRAAGCADDMRAVGMEDGEKGVQIFKVSPGGEKGRA